MILQKKIFQLIPFYIISSIIALIVTIPILTTSFGFLENTSDYFNILKNSILIIYIKNSFWLVFSVLALTFMLGFFSSYLISFFKFPGVKFFQWALLLSFAVPGYIFGYSLHAFFENYGLAFTILTSLFGKADYNQVIPNINGFIGTVLSLSLTLYGYVYVLTRATFFYQSKNLIDVGKNLGFSKFKSFTKIIIPSTRPSIVVGLSLVAMETLSDFGTVSFFNIPTLTTGIYNAWISFDDLTLANRLAFILILLIFLFFLIEKFSRKKAKYHTFQNDGLDLQERKKLKGLKSVLAFLFCGIIFFVSFVFPVSQMIYWSLKYPHYINNINFWELNLNTLYLVIISSFILLVASFASNFSNRITKSKYLELLNTISVSGYALPGVMLSIALITFLSWFSNIFGYNIKSIFVGSLIGLVTSYFIRFYSLSFNSLKSNYLKININVDESAYLLGYNNYAVFSKIHVPILKRSCFLIITLIAIEIIKELPITLIMRPFNFETFATVAFSYAQQDLLEAAAFPSLCLLFWSTIFIFCSFKYFLPENQR